MEISYGLWDDGEVYCKCCILGRPEDVRVCVLLMVHDIGDSLDCSPHLESRMRVLTVSLTVTGRSGTCQRPVHGQRYPVRTAASVMLIVLEL